MAQMCRYCGTTNRDTARFCQGCSRPLVQDVVCPTCGAVNLPNARFCHQCGTALATGGLVAASHHTGMLPAQSLLAHRYLILQKIGQGGMGGVYKATDTRLGQKIVALKELSESALTNPLDKQEARQAFEQEATILALLSHPNLPRVTDHFSEGGKQYLVMDFIDGKTLKDLLDAAKGPLDVKQVVDWAGQLCDVLGYLHSRQPPVIFRDLKPGNIMLDRDGKIKLIDFGIARHFKAGKATDTTSFGTAGYAPPEQYGKGQTDARSDIYALGATLHHLLTGCDPADNPFSFAAVRSLNPKVSAEVEAAIMKAVEQDVINRWQNAAQMKQALTAGSPMMPVRPITPAAPVPVPLVQAPPVAYASVPLLSPVLVRPQELDFGTMLPSRLRWQSLVIENRNTPIELHVASSAFWITVTPMYLKCRPGERCRVTIGVNTSRLTADTGHEEKGSVSVILGAAKSTILIRTRVESVPGIQHILTIVIDLIAGALLGLLIVGVLGNLVLMLLGRDLSSVLLTCGTGIAGLVIVFIGLRIQDTINLILALGTGVLVCSLAGASVGALAGLVGSLLLGSQVVLLTSIGLGLLFGAILGIVCVCKAPARWGIWPF